MGDSKLLFLGLFLSSVLFYGCLCLFSVFFFCCVCLLFFRHHVSVWLWHINSDLVFFLVNFPSITTWLLCMLKRVAAWPLLMVCCFCGLILFSHRSSILSMPFITAEFFFRGQITWNPPILLILGPTVCPAQVQQATAITGSLLPQTALAGVQKRSGGCLCVCLRAC